MHTIKPKPLTKNAVIGIVSPASPQRDPARLDRGIAYLEGLGYRVELGKNALQSYGGYLAGTDDERREDIEEMFLNPGIDAIFSARGGYGTSRFLSTLDYDCIRNNPKIFVGFSDTTALQAAIFVKTGLVTFSGAMPSVDMADDFRTVSEEWFWGMLTEPDFALSHTVPAERLAPGGAKGKLICGNLSVMTTLLGTPYCPDFTGNILLLEDIGEEPYRVDRMLSHLENAGAFTGAQALAFGQFTESAMRPASVPQRPVSEVLADYAERSHLPVVSNILYGHQPEKLTLPYGILAEIPEEGAEMRFVERAVE